MSRRNLADEWRLEDQEAPTDQWKLEPAEQNAIAQWELRDEAGGGVDPGDWQPVAYSRERREPRGNWVLPSLVGVALVAVIAYVAWIALERAGLFGPVAPVATPTSVAAVVPEPEVEVEPTPIAIDTPPPTPTLEPPPTPTLEPTATPLPLVNLESIVVTGLGGVNARSEPNLQGEILQVLLQDEATYLVVADQADWIQIALPDQRLAWVAAEFVQRRSETVLIEEANRRRAAVGLPLLAVPEGAAPLEEGPGVEPGDAVTTTPPIAAPVAISVTINITAGLNAREAPDLGGTVVQLLAGNTTYSAFARTEDNQWVQILLPDGRLAWVATQFVTLGGDLQSLSTEPATLESITRATTALAPPAAPITTTTPLTPSTEITPTVTQVVDGVTASVTNLAGANARATPDREAETTQLLSFGGVLPVVGRSADGEWVQVTLEEGRLAWVLVNAVTLSGDVASLPIVTP